MLSFTVTFFITILNLGLLYLALKKLLFDRVTGFMDQRAEKVRRNLDEAAISRTHADGLKAQYETLMAEAESEAQSIVKDAEGRAAEEAKRLLAKAEEDAQAARRRGEEAVARERERAYDALAADIARLAVETAGRLLGRQTEADDHRAAEVIVRELEASRAR